MYVCIRNIFDIGLHSQTIITNTELHISFYTKYRETFYTYRVRLSIRYLFSHLIAIALYRMSIKFLKPRKVRMIYSSNTHENPVDNGRKNN